MLLSKQQTYMLETIQKLGCVRKDQLIALFRLEFCAEDPEAAERVGGSALHRLCSCRQVRESADVYHMDNTKPNERVLEAIDVMIELAKAKPLDFHGEKSAGAAPVQRTGAEGAPLHRRGARGRSR